MKITQFILTLGTGGAEAIVKDYAAELKARGHEVEVVTLLPLANTVNEQILRDNGISVRSVYEEIYSFQSNKFLVRAVRKFRRDKLVSRWIERYVERYHPDVIHMHLTVEQFFAPISDKLEGIRLVYTCHNEATHYFGAEHPHETANVKHLIDNNGMQLIALHDRMAEELNGIFGIQNTKVLNNPINVKRFAEARGNRQKMRKALNIPEDAFVVGHVGRFTYQKNHGMLVRIFAEVAKERQNAFLLMIGAGELKAEVVSQLNSLGLADKYLILSDRKDIPELLSAMDVFVFPSRFEGASVAFLEVQASGIRCVASDIVPDTIVVSQNVSLVGLGEPLEAWTDAIYATDLKNDTSKSISDFDIKNVTDRLLEIYQK